MRRTPRLLAVAPALAVGLLVAWAPPAQAQEGEAAPPIVNGSTTSEYPAVGALIGCSSSSCFSFCSGTLVDPNWVITAAHCVEAEQSYARSGYTTWFGVGPQLGALDDYVEIEDSYEHPQYSSYTLAHDIGLLELTGAGMTSVDPLPVNEDRVDSGWKGEELTYVGYGVTSDNRSDGGVKRTADMPVHSYDDGFVYTLDIQDGQNVCYGDSGGAALESLGDGVFELVAANSHVYGYQYSGYMCEGGGSGAARVDTHLDWIRQYVDVGGYDPNEDQGSGGDSGSGGGSGSGGDSGGGGGDGGGSGGDGGGSGGDGGNTAPEAWAADLLLPVDGVGRTRVLVNDPDEGDVHYFAILEEPQRGTAELEGEGWLRYTPEPGFMGEDFLVVLVADEAGETGLAEVPVQVVAREATSAGCASLPGRATGSAGLALLLGLLGLRRRP